MKKALYLALVLLVIGLFWWGILSYMTLADIQKIGKETAAFANARPVTVFALLAALQSLGMALSLPTKALLTLLAGALLGPAIGSAATFIGVISGTTVLFFVTRYLLRGPVIRRLGERAKHIERRLSGRPIRALIGLRLFITLPFGPITMAAALSSMRFKDFITGTMIGDLPVIIAYAIAAEQLFSLASVSDALSPWTITLLIGVGLFFLLTTFIGRRQRATPQR
jgi:phospholipase D1/2